MDGLYTDQAGVEMQSFFEVTLPQLVDPKPINRQRALSSIDHMLSKLDGPKSMYSSCVLTYVIFFRR